MSAYVVHPRTIDLIISAAQRFNRGYSFYFDKSARDQMTPDNDGYVYDHVSPHTNAQELGQMLWNENHHSVNVRYRLTDAVPAYTFKPVDLDYASAGMSPAILVLQSIRCLRYQSCEAGDYETTNARKLLDWVESACINDLTNTANAPWGWTPDWTEERRAEAKTKIASIMVRS